MNRSRDYDVTGASNGVMTIEEYLGCVECFVDEGCVVPDVGYPALFWLGGSLCAITHVDEQSGLAVGEIWSERNREWKDVEKVDGRRLFEIKPFDPNGRRCPVGYAPNPSWIGYI